MASHQNCLWRVGRLAELGVQMTATPRKSLAGGPTMRVGAAEDAAKWGDPQAKMQLARESGFDTVRLTAQWTRGLTAPSATDLSQLQAAAGAARAVGIEPVIAIYNVGSSSTPADDSSRGDFVEYATAIAAGLPTVTRFIVCAQALPSAGMGAAADSIPGRRRTASIAAYPSVTSMKPNAAFDSALSFL